MGWGRDEKSINSKSCTRINNLAIVKITSASRIEGRGTFTAGRLSSKKKEKNDIPAVRATDQHHQRVRNSVLRCPRNEIPCVQATILVHLLRKKILFFRDFGRNLRIFCGGILRGIGNSKVNPLMANQLIKLSVDRKSLFWNDFLNIDLIL